MADDLETVLPLLRERSVYVKDDGSGNDNSDFISSSFKGILRLSPNDSASYIEKENYISYDETTANYISFEDDISKQLSKQFIRVSTSDGYLLDLRISDEGVEYNNLYVLGSVYTKNPIELFSTSKNSFRVGQSYLPSTVNMLDINTVKTTKQYNPVSNETINDTFILMNMGSGMEFVNAKNIVDIFIKEALMELSSVPTGSIHAIPVNIEQYEKLLKKSKGHNVAVDDNDPLIRDYLLCDGSYYRVHDFPELAKILHNETINYWSTQTTENSDDNRLDITHLELKSETNDIKQIKVYKGEHADDGVEVDEESKYVSVFRVPDYRGMFIQSVVPGIKSKDKVGTFQIDSMKDGGLSIKHGLDNHYHYIVLDAPANKRIEVTTGALSKTVMDKVDYEGTDIKINGFDKLPPNVKPGALSRFGGIVGSQSTHWPKGSCGKCCKSCVGSSGSSPIYKPSLFSYNCHAAGTSGGYILSTLNKKQAQNVTKSSWSGVSSWPIDMSISSEEIKNNTNLDQHLNYTKTPGDPIYDGHSKEYVKYDSDELKSILGYENTPEFYAILPLIKI